MPDQPTSEKLMTELRSLGDLLHDRRLRDAVESAYDEIERLRAWKAEATQVLIAWHDLADEVRHNLGDPVHLLGAREVDVVRAALRETVPDQPTSEMPARPFLSFYGAKWRMAARLPAPRYPVIVEPFAGSMGYSVRHGSGGKVIGVEMDPTIANVWRWLMTTTPEAVPALPLLNPDDDLRQMTDLDPAARALIGLWLNKGMTAPCNRPSKWMRNPLPGRLETFWGDGIRERIARQLPLIADWSIIEGDYTQAPDIEATWLIDPPYQGTPGNRYRFGNSGIDYQALAEWCRTRRGQVIVCEQVGADWLPFEPVTFAVKAAAKGGGSYSAEAIWTMEKLFEGEGAA